MLKIIGFNLVFTCMLFIAKGQQENNEQIIKNIDAFASNKIQTIAPGCVILIAKSDKVIYKKAFGFAKIESNITMKPDMIFRLGSMSKQFTAVAILQLMELGKLSLTDSIQKFVKDFPFKGHTITIENLLTHTSGIKNYFEIINKDNAHGKESYTPKEGVDYFKKEHLEFNPGTQFKYSNSNYYLLGYIIEQVSGESYEQYLIDHIFKKADLGNTYYIHTEKRIPNVAEGYIRENNKFKKAVLQNVSVMYAAGALMSNAEDLFKWHISLKNNILLKRETLLKAYTPYKFPDNTFGDYGYGWFLRDIDGSKTVEHSGSTDGFQTDEIYLPAEDIYIVVLCNGFAEDMNWQMATNDIARLALGKLLNNKVIVEDAILRNYVGTYIFNSQHILIVTYKDGNLFIEDTNPNDHLPRVELYPSSNNSFFMKEAPLRFEFITDPLDNSLKIITYNTRGKDAEWKKVK